LDKLKENKGMNITPQDILEQEFHVRFRGFDMSEVDAFLERVAEKIFKVLEENQRLGEQVAELQKSSETPVNLDTNLQEVLSSVQEIAGEIKSLDLQPQPADLSGALSELKQVAEKISSELAGLKEDRQVYSNLEENLKEVVASAKEVAGEMRSLGPQEAPSTVLPKGFDELRKSTENFGAELADLKKEITALQQSRGQQQSEVQELLQAHLEQMEERLLKELRGAALQPQEHEKPTDKKPSKKQKTTAPKHIEKVVESRVFDGDAELPDYDPKELDDGTHFNEADILNEDKLRDLFASIMDDDESPREAETASDTLFGGQGLVEDDHEPEVTFILDDALEEEEPGQQAGKKPDN
jgi:cell division initiation protein